MILTRSGTTLAPLPTARGYAGAAAVDGKLYVIGGSPSPQSQVTSCLATVESYDPTTNVWATETPLPAARTFVNVASVGSLLYVFGTPCTAGAFTSVYDHVTKQWSDRSPIPTSRVGFGVAELGGLIYVAGGGSNGIPQGAVYAYNPQTDTWTSVTTLPTPRFWPMVTSANGRLFVIGGGNWLDLVEVYDPAANVWTRTPPLPVGLIHGGAAVVGADVFVLGGETPSGGIQNTIWRYAKPAP